MARSLVLHQVRSTSGKLQLRGVYSQKKKLWEALTTLAKEPELTGWLVLDDVTEKRYAALYRTMCDRLRLIGRATFLKPDGTREFLVVETQMNATRDWDTDEAGKPRPNPAEGSADEEG